MSLHRRKMRREIMKTTILVIPSEGNSPDTEQWYIKKLKERYGKELNVIVFEDSKARDSRSSRNRKFYGFYII